MVAHEAVSLWDIVRQPWQGSRVYLVRQPKKSGSKDTTALDQNRMRIVGQGTTEVDLHD